MDPNTVVLEISSDEDSGWNDHDGSGISDGLDDHNWLTELLDEVSKENYGGDDSDEVVVVVSESEKSGNKSTLKSCVVELDDDCVVLENDPNEPAKVRDDNRSNVDDDPDDIVVVSEKGQVACRDYPHPRHLCIKFPFSTTPNQSHCEQCYCYVCDSLAPCVYWGNGNACTDHCHATDKDEFWRLERKNAKNGTKGAQPVHKVPDTSLLNRLHPVDHHGPAPALVQPQNQISRPGSIHAHTSHPNIVNQNRSHPLTSRNKFHPDLVSQILKTNSVRAHQSYNRLHNPVFKRTGSVGAATAARGNFGNTQNYRVHGMLSGPSKYLESLQQNAVNTSAPYPPQSQTYASSTVNHTPMPPPPSTPRLQFFNHSNPLFQSQVNSNPFTANPIYQQPHVVPPLPPRSQLASGQPSYMVPAQPSYPIPPLPQTRVDSPLSPVSDYTQIFSQGSQAQSPVIDPGYKDNGLNLPTNQVSATIEDAGATNESSLAAVPSGLADYQYDWIFDNQPVEPGFMDIHGPYGLNDYSSDSSFIDTGPIFDF